MKDVRNHGVCPVRAFCGQRGLFRCGRPDISTYWGKNVFDFSKFKVCSHGHGDWASTEKGANFSRFFADVFCGRPHINNWNYG